MKIEGSIALVTGSNRGFVVPLALDVTRPEQIAAAAAQARDVTLLVNNAGISRAQSLLAPDAIAASHAELETNVFGPLLMARAFAPILATNGVARAVKAGLSAVRASYLAAGDVR